MIVWVRHGETAVNRSGQLQGRSDAPLTAHGEAQARCVARALLADGPVQVLTSPLTRARATAATIASVSGAPLAVDDRLVELDYGDWDGRPVGSVRADEWQRWRSDPSFAPPGGERLRDVRARVGAFCVDVDPGDGVVVAVSHVSPIKAAVAWALDVGDEVTWRTHLAVASVTRIGRRGDAGVLLSFNETAHLAELEPRAR